MKAEKYERQWRNGAVMSVKIDEMLAVLEANGFEVRKDGKHHYIAEHPKLADNAYFTQGGGKAGRFGINAHFKGKTGHVHVRAVKEALKALDHIRKTG